jgi:hypothetical protein
VGGFDGSCREGPVFSPCPRLWNSPPEETRTAGSKAPQAGSTGSGQGENPGPSRYKPSKPSPNQGISKKSYFFHFFSKKSCFFNKSAIQYILEIIKKTSALIGRLLYRASIKERTPTAVVFFAGTHCRQGCDLREVILTFQVKTYKRKSSLITPASKGAGVTFDLIMGVYC